MVKPFDLLPAVVRRRANEVAPGVTRIARQAAMAIDRELVYGTPVDKGVARSNWIGSNGTPFADVIPAYAPGKKLGIGERANAEAAIAQAKTAINTFQAGKGQKLYLTNNVPYIGRLNNGHSKQAPAGFIQKGVQAGVESVKGARIFKG